jgi:DNA-binding winged helix-turn-helix (wHTH) protein
VEFFFGEHHLDVDRRELRRGADLIAVEPQVFDLLVYLLRNRDRVICKDELIATVWRGRIVSESTLTSHIHAVRKAIGDTGAAQRLIRTVPRKGVRFVGALKEERARSLVAPPTGVVDPAKQVFTATRGDVVSKDDLIARRWLGGGVEEANIYVYATALPDDRREGPSSVVTVPGRGSRLTGRASAGLEEPPTVQVPSLPAKLSIMVDRDEPQDRPPIVERRQLTARRRKRPLFSLLSLPPARGVQQNLPIIII